MKRRVMSYIEEDLYKEVKKEVHDNEYRSMSGFIKALIQRYFQEQDEREKREEIKQKLNEALDLMEDL